MQVMELGARVRNVKTRVVGTVESFLGEDAVVKTEDGLSATCRPQDLEVLNEREYGLVRALVEARRKKTELTQKLDEAKSVAAALEDELIDYMRTNNLQSTAPYDGVGKVEIDGMKVMPSINEENRKAAFAAIKEMGRGEIIKEAIHPATLASFVTELIDNGTPVPASIGYFLKPKLSFKKK